MKRVDIPTENFINRDQEIKFLRKIIRERPEGGDILVIKGNIGVGKTRLVREVIEAVEFREVVWGNCSYIADYVAYYPIRELIKDKLQQQGANVLKHIAPQYTKELSKLIPDILSESSREGDGIDATVDKFRFYEGIKRVLEKSTRAQIIVVDNMQWIDKAAVGVLRYLINAFKNDMIQFMFLYRTDEETEVLEDFLGFLEKKKNVTEFTVKPFNELDTRDMLVSILGELPEDTIVRYVMHETGGVPFYIEETIRSLILSKHLKVVGDHWHFVEPQKDDVPDNIAEIAVSKYNSLSKESRNVLEVASIIGWFDIPLIQEMTGFEAGRIVSYLSEIEALGLVKYGVDKIEFNDNISRNAIYKLTKSKEDIKSSHSKMGDKIKERSMDRERDVVENLAFQYYQSRDQEKGVRFCIEAGDSARAKYANEAAIRYYSWAIELLHPPTKDKMKAKLVECLVRRIDLYIMLGDHESALKDIENGMMMAKDIDDKRSQIDLMFHKANLYARLAQPRKTISYAEHSKKIAEEMSNMIKVAAAMNLIANSHMALGKHKTALEFFGRALEIYEDRSHLKGMATVLNNMGITYKNLGEYDRALQSLMRALSFSQKLGNKYIEAACRNGIGNIHYFNAEYAKALEYYEDSLNLQAEIGFKRGEAIAMGNIGNTYIQLAQYSDALKFVKEALRMKQEIEDKRGEAGDLSNIGVIYKYLGEYKKSLDYFKQALNIVQEINDTNLQIHVRIEMGNVYYFIGDFGPALMQHEKVKRLIELVNADWEDFYNLLYLTRLYLAKNNYDVAQQCLIKASEKITHLSSTAMVGDYLIICCELFLEENKKGKFEKQREKLDDMCKKIKTKRFQAMVSYIYGRYYMLDSQFEKAYASLQRALEIFKTTREIFMVGKIEYFVGLLEMSHANKPKARDALKNARDVFAKIAAIGWEEKVAQALRDIG